MSEIEVSISLPTDDDSFFRRQCPLCRREFKVLLEKKEMEDIAKKGIESFMLNQNADSDEADLEKKDESEYYCPYCNQLSPSSDWWTDEQKNYIRIHAENIAARLINEQLIGPLKRKFSGSSSGPISFKVEADEMKMKEPWISPETNDMNIFDLPCCKRKIKIREDWQEKIHCFFCGFPHKN